MSKKYELNKSIKEFTVSDICMIGNINNGSIIGLDSRGVEVLAKIKNSENNSTFVTEEDDEVLLSEMRSLGFFSNETTSKLTSAYLHVTDNCNLHCIGCYSYVNNRNSLCDLTFEKMTFILDKLSCSGVEKIVISGGEPFLRNDFAKICEYAKKEAKIKELIVITNGTQPIEKYFQAIPFIDDLSISVDGYSETTRFIRDNNIMPYIINLINNLKQHVKIHLISTLHKQNKSLMQEYLEFAKELGVTLSFSIFTVDNSEKKYDEWVLDDKDLLEISQKLSQVEDSVVDTAHFLDKMSLSCRERCEAGRTVISIDASGDIYPCHMLHTDECKLGNIISDNLDTVLNDEKNIFQHLKVDDFNTCVDCEYKYLCGGGCRGRSYYKYNSVSEPDAYCSLFKEYYHSFFKDLKKRVENVNVADL